MMATLPQCPRCENCYSGTDFCPLCRIADLEQALLGLLCAVRENWKDQSGFMTDQLAEAMRNAEIVAGPL